MMVRGIRWAGVRTDDIAAMRTFATAVLGMAAAEHDSADLGELTTAAGSRVGVFARADPARLTPPGGSRFEWFGSADAADGPWLFERNPVVLGFLVEDIHAARAELERAPGVELLGELREAPGGYAWQHFRAPDGHVYELTADPAA